MPVIRCRVVWGRPEVMLMRAPTSRFSSVDLPTFGRPTIVAVPARCAGRGSGARRELISLPRSLLLRGPPAGAFAQRAYAHLRDDAFDLELLLVRLAAGRHHGVLGQRALAPLEIFLQQRLGILAGGCG